METARHIIWEASPVILTVGPVTLRWYGLLFAAGFLAGLLVMQWVFRTEGKTHRDVDRLFQYVVIGTLVGARLGHCLFYEPGYYLAHPVEIFKIWNGGLASHGTSLGLLAALWLYARNTPGQSYLWILDRLSIATVLAGAFIRLGNLFNSEILGKPADLPWAFMFIRIDFLPRHPVQLYESLAYMCIFILLLGLYRNQGPRIRPGLLLGLFLTGTFGFRFGVEFFKTRQAAFAQGMPLSMGQLLSLPLIFLGVWVLYRSYKYEKGSL